MSTENVIPTQLQKQLEQVKAQAAAETAQEQPQAVDLTPQPEPAPVPAPQAIPPAPPAPTPEVPTQQVIQIPGSNDSSWEERYKAMKGKYDAEVPRMAQDIKDLRAELSELRNAKPDPQPKPQTQVLEISDDFIRERVSEEQIEEFGLDHWRTILKIQLEASQNLGPKVDPNESRINQLESQLANQREESFFKELVLFVPDWEALNKDEDFHKFLAGTNQLVGASYQSLLDNARNDCDAHRVAAIFDAYKAQAAGFNVLSSPKASQIMPSPQGSSPSGDNSTKISFADWNARMNKVLQGGLEPHELAAEQEKLLAMYNSGQVERVEDASQTVSASFV